MPERTFDPNMLAPARCQELVDQAISSIGIEMRAQILTSRDPRVLKLRDQLKTDNVPGGFRKWQLPVYLSESSYLFITEAEPGARAAQHSHDDGDGIRFIIRGSIRYADQELTAGDWMFIPAGKSYEFSVGEEGALMCYCYCYCCCCA